MHTITTKTFGPYLAWSIWSHFSAFSFPSSLPTYIGRRRGSILLLTIHRFRERGLGSSIIHYYGYGKLWRKGTFRNKVIATRWTNSKIPNVKGYRAAAIAQCTRLCLQYCCTGFEARAQNNYFLVCCCRRPQTLGIIWFFVVVRSILSI